MLKQIGATLAADDSDEYIEIEIPELVEDKKIVTDPFAKGMAVDSIPKKQMGVLRKKMENESKTLGTKYVDPEIVSGYALYDLVTPPYDMDILSKVYDENPFHNAAVNAKSVNAVGLGYRWIQTRKTNKKLERAGEKDTRYQNIMDSIHNEMERLDDVFESLNTDETFTESLVKAAIDMYSLGNGYIEVSRNIDGKIGYLGHVPAQAIRIRKRRDGFIQQAQNKFIYFRNFGDKDAANPLNNDDDPNELMHFKIYSPSNSYYGIPHIMSALPAVIGNRFAADYNIDYFENKAIPRYAIVIKGAKLSEKSKKDLIQYFRNEVKGKHHGTLVIPVPSTMGSNVDVKFEKLESQINDGSFQKYRRDNRDEIITAHRVPPGKIGVSEHSNLAISRDADKTFKEQVMAPDQAMFEHRINRIVKEFTDVIEMEFETVDIIDADMKSRIHDRYARIEVLDPNEIRNEIGKPAKKNANEVLPFATKVTLEVAKLQDKQKSDALTLQEKQGDQQAKADAQAAAAGRTGAGAPAGNTNNGKKTGPETPKDQTGTRNERGQTQDTSGVRERS